MTQATHYARALRVLPRRVLPRSAYAILNDAASYGPRAFARELHSQTVQSLQNRATNIYEAYVLRQYLDSGDAIADARVEFFKTRDAEAQESSFASDAPTAT